MTPRGYGYSNVGIISLSVGGASHHPNHFSTVPKVKPRVPGLVPAENSMLHEQSDILDTMRTYRNKPVESRPRPGDLPRWRTFGRH